MKQTLPLGRPSRRTEDMPAAVACGRRTMFAVQDGV